MILWVTESLIPAPNFWRNNSGKLQLSTFSAVTAVIDHCLIFPVFPRLSLSCYSNHRSSPQLCSVSTPIRLVSASVLIVWLYVSDYVSEKGQNAFSESHSVLTLGFSFVYVALHMVQLSHLVLKCLSSYCDSHVQPAKTRFHNKH